MASDQADHVVDVTSVSAAQVRAFQMDRHHLRAREPSAESADVIGRLCGLDARLDYAAELSLWARVRGLERGAIKRELWSNRELVKTWAMGGVLHYLPATEYPLWNGAICARSRAQQQGRELGLSGQTTESLVTGIGEVLADATLTIEEISTALEQQMTEMSPSQFSLAEWRALLRIAASEGELCIVPSDDNRHRFTHPNRWIGELDDFDPDLAKEDVTMRYLGTYGPATAAQFGKWMGLGEGGAERWIRDLGDQVARVNVEGTEGWLPRDSISDLTRARSQQTVRLLPEFDPYIVGTYHEPASAIDPDRREQIRGGNGWIPPTFVVEGEVAGTWAYERTSEDVEVTVHPFEQPDSWARQEAGVEAVRLAEYFESDLVFNWRPH